MKRMTVYDLYPFLFSIYPIIALCSHNLIYVNFNSIIRSLILALVLTLLLFILLSFLTRNKENGKLLTSVILLVFFSYGQIYDILASSLGEAIRHRFLSAIFLFIFILIGWFILRARSIPLLLVKFLSVTSLALVIISIYPIVENFGHGCHRLE